MGVTIKANLSMAKSKVKEHFILLIKTIHIQAHGKMVRRKEKENCSTKTNHAI
jgi:hypothetical protein